MYHHAMSDPTRPIPSRFEFGSHLRVCRPGGSSFHGIYLSDASVIELGGQREGKWTATMRQVSLAAFEGGGTTQVVAHSRKPRFGQPSWSRSGDSIIRRAWSLVSNYTPGRYEPIGNNCKDLADWCATGIVTKGVRLVLGFTALMLAVNLVDLVMLLTVHYPQPSGPPSTHAVNLGNGVMMTLTSYPEPSRPLSAYAWFSLYMAVQLAWLAAVFWSLLVPTRRCWRDIARRAAGIDAHGSP